MNLAYNILLVSFEIDLMSFRSSKRRVVAAIQKEDWSCLSETVYLVYSLATPQGLYERLKPHLDANDTLLVFKVDANYFGQHTKPVVDWMAKKLK